MTAQRWVPPLVWAAIILAATSIPNPDIPAPARSDLLAHAGLYGVLGYLVARALAPGRVAVLVAAVAACSAFGALDEWHQLYIPGRFASVDDWGADTVGAALGAVAYAAARRRRESST